MRNEPVKCGAMELSARIAGDSSRPAILLLHGWPHDSSLYDSVIDRLGRTHFTIALDLPAVGDSHGAPPSAEKHRLAEVVLDAAERLGARSILIAGIDVGGMIAFAAARDQQHRIAGAAVGNTAIPGISPWDAVASDPRIFHFALHAVPRLPEQLVAGRERTYFDFFFDFLGSKTHPLPDRVRAAFARAYRRREALTAGFDWYRAFAADAARNREPKAIATPILYFRGDADGGSPDDYVEGLRAAGALRVRGETLAGTAEFAPIEAPEAFAAMIETFAAECLEPAPA